VTCVCVIMPTIICVFVACVCVVMPTTTNVCVVYAGVCVVCLDMHPWDLK
jgi:hypothetical protein